MMICKTVFTFLPALQTEFPSHSGQGADPEDLWDFGTVRHVNRPSTIGRATVRTEVGLTYPQPISGLEQVQRPNGARTTNASSSSSISSGTSSITVRAEAPMLVSPPPSRGTEGLPKQQSYGNFHVTRSPSEAHSPEAAFGLGHNDQSTVRTTPRRDRQRSYDSNGSSGSDDGDVKRLQGQMSSLELEESEEYDDYDDRSMLDSVVLPAIASVSDEFHIHLRMISQCHFSSSFSRGWPPLRQRRS